MNDDDDFDLKSAFKAVKDTYDGESPQADATLERALFKTRKDSKRRFVRWTLIPIAAALVVSTAWASATGHLPRAIDEALHPTHAPPVATPSVVALAAPPPAQPVEEAPPPSVSTQAPQAAAAPPPPPSSPTPAPTSAQLPVQPSVVVSAPPPAVPVAVIPAPQPSAADPNAPLFAEAHRLHFTEHDPAKAIPAWDRYLQAAPNGRFVPEAKYNRALAMIRVGRRAEAITELTAFAQGKYGNYRKQEAEALLEALAKDAG